MKYDFLRFKVHTNEQTCLTLNNVNVCVDVVFYPYKKLCMVLKIQMKEICLRLERQTSPETLLKAECVYILQTLDRP